MRHCKFCCSPVYKKNRCEVHYRKFLQKRAASQAAPKCQCGAQARLGHRLCGGCLHKVGEAAKQQARNQFIDDMMARARGELPYG